MGVDLYQTCEQCDGAGELPDPRDENGLVFLRCPGCGGTGRWKTGLTLGQVDKIRDDRDRLLVALADLYDPDETGDSLKPLPSVVKAAGILKGRRGEVEEARRRLGL